ncbi:retrovirus-related pol polyprotein from transposon TNT 1-94 [Tanacetum coccineum]|uniref:Retrovirus-related pol polyprotein from transposon TNT 1-94 n=1 Tax=Tanacetum coccineum TaxID=301880 RepID=A0ABQ5CE00_9ASTR
MNQFYEMKGIKREFSVARTPQQNGVAQKKNRTLIEAVRTMLVESKLPTTFWAEAVNTTCYVLNKVLVIKPHNKTPYELIRERTPLIDFMKPFGCPVTILNTRDHLGKFDGKADEGFFVGYSVVSKAMRVFNKRTKIVKETSNIRFLENAPNVTGNVPDWLFDVDSMSKSMNYAPVVAGNQTNGIVGKRDNIVAGQAEKNKEPEQEYILIPICTTDPLISQDPKIMIGSLMYLTASRPDITFAVCACASDYAGASLDRKSTTGAEYVDAANCCGQVLWIQNQMLDCGFNFMNTKIYIDNESTICIVKNSDGFDGCIGLKMLFGPVLRVKHGEKLVSAARLALCCWAKVSTVSHRNPPYKFKWTEKTVPVAEGSSETTTEGYMENYKNVSQDIRDQLNAEAQAVQIILTGIDNDIYSIVDACPNACEVWKAIERLKQGESINVQDLETNLYWEFRKFTSRNGESLESYYSRFVRLVKQSQELKIVSYHKLYDILKKYQNEVNEIRVERLARTTNPLALVAQQQPIYHPQNHPTQNNQYSSNISQQHTKNRGKAIINSSAPTYDQEPVTVTEDDEMSKEKEIDKLMALISLSFKKIYKPTNNNLRTSSNTSRANQDNSPRINRGTGYENQRVVNVVGARENVGTQVVQKSGIQCYNCKEYGHVSRECQKPKRVKDAAYHKEKMLLCKQEEAGVQLNAEQADWKDDTDDESDDQELEAHYMYMAQIQEVTPNAVDNSGPIFDAESMHKVHSNNDNYNVFAIENEHLEQPEPVNDIYLEEQGDTNITIDSLDICYDRDQDDQDDTDELDQERDLLASLIKKLKCAMDDSKNCNKFLETSNKDLVDKLKDLKKFQAELDKYHDVNYASKVAIDCAKAKGD